VVGADILQAPHPLCLQYEEAVAVEAIMATQLAGYQGLVLVVIVLSTTIVEVLTLGAILCCHHSNILRRLAAYCTFTYYTTILTFSIIGCPEGSFPMRFLTKILCFLYPSACYTSFPSFSF
jgi:hypothetical protein